jgi:hypothetical protein
MPEKNHSRSEVNHPQEVVGVAFPSRDDASKIMVPGKKPLDLPASPSTSQGSAILGATVAIGSVRRNQFDVICGCEVAIEAVTVVSLVADQSRRELVEEPRGERGVDEGDLMRRSTGHVDGDRKTMAVANRHDFAAFTAASRANGGAPFFAELKLASMKASLRSSFPRSRRSSASRCKTRSRRPLRCHC